MKYIWLFLAYFELFDLLSRICLQFTIYYKNGININIIKTEETPLILISLSRYHVYVMQSRQSQKIFTALGSLIFGANLVGFITRDCPVGI